MKTTVVLLASIASALALTGCDFTTESDDLVDPGTKSPPFCSVVGLTLQSAMVTSTRGGYADLSLIISNSPGCAVAYNIHADIVAMKSNNWVGETTFDYDFLGGGESTRAAVEVPVTGLPDEVYCTLTWSDEGGESFTAVVRSDLYGGLYLSATAKGGASKVR